uniref:DUF354 domain-containing protein n=1 Tax=candidate division WOR-3 bacterium TaxID=2052148 RepID=A0A7C4U6U1_UNCW3
MRIWIDIDNAPHVLIMHPIIKELKRMGHNVYITARDYGQTIELLRMKGIQFKLIGRHPGKSPILKICFLFLRMIKLFIWALDKNFDVSLSHGSRSIVIPSYILGIKNITMYDYEHINDFIFKIFSRKILLPFPLKEMETKKIHIYPGLKEDIYLWESEYKPDWDKGLNIDRSKVIGVLRPPATMAHYHNPLSEKLFKEILFKLESEKNFIGLVIPRTKEQFKDLEILLKNFKNFILLKNAVDGYSLLRDADIVIGGGGTMNREAALLGCSVYSIFKGEKGKVDIYLEKIGRMKFIEKSEDINMIKISKKEIKSLEKNNTSIAKFICDFVINC